MKSLIATLGFLMLIAGGGLMLFAFARPTTVGNLHSLALLIDRVCFVIAGATLAIVGSVFLSTTVDTQSRP